MKPEELKRILRNRAAAYAESMGVGFDDTHDSALLFSRVEDNLCPASFESIKQHQAWLKRTLKSHPNVPYAYEMQSSNSSDALLMSVFCHPHAISWKGLHDLLGVSRLSPFFGFPAEVKKNGRGDRTEIDMVMEDVFFEAKLTEKDFTEKEASVVRGYDQFEALFQTASLSRLGDRYDNYQIIRNLLAAAQHGKRHILICDERRPDLVQRYMDTVNCLRSPGDQERCGVVYWQQIRRNCGEDLREFLMRKYDIC